MSTDTNNLDPLARFSNSNNHFKLTKLESKRPNSTISVGESRTGFLRLFKYPKTDKLPEATGLFVSTLRTSPIIKIVDFGADFTLFETEGGVYRLEDLGTPSDGG